MGLGAWLKGRISLDSSDVDKSLTKTKRGAQTLSQQMSGLKHVIAGAFATGMLARFVMTMKRTTFEIEALKLRFAILFKDTDKAAKHTADLLDFSAKTPFQIDDISKASLLLYRFSDGAMGGRRSLDLVGDAAAAAGRDIEEVAMWVGRAYGSIQSGRPFGEAAMRLQEMGILGATARNQMEALQKTGASNAAVWNVLYGELVKNEGGMKALSESGKGLESTLKDNVNLAVNEYGEAFSDAAKGGLQTMIDKTRELREDGSIGAWAEMTVAALSFVDRAIKKSVEGWGYLKRGNDQTWAFFGALAANLQNHKSFKSMKEIFAASADVALEQVDILHPKNSKPTSGYLGESFNKYYSGLKAKHQTNPALAGTALNETDASIAGGLDRNPSDALVSALGDAAEKTAEEISAALKKALGESDLKIPTIRPPGVEAERGGLRDMARYDRLREIGANILGSGRAVGAPADRNAEIAAATKETAQGVQRLVQAVERPPVPQVAPADAVF